MKLQALISKLISDVAKFNQLESTRRSNAFNNKIHSREYKQRCQSNKQRISLQTKAYEKDRENAQIEKAGGPPTANTRGGITSRGQGRGRGGNRRGALRG